MICPLQVKFTKAINDKTHDTVINFQQIHVQQEFISEGRMKNRQGPTGRSSFEKPHYIDTETLIYPVLCGEPIYGLKFCGPLPKNHDELKCFVNFSTSLILYTYHRIVVEIK